MRGNCAHFLPLSTIKTLPNILKVDLGGRLLEINKTFIWGTLCNNLFRATFGHFVSDMPVLYLSGRPLFQGYEKKGADVCKVPGRACCCHFHEVGGNLAEFFQTWGSNSSQIHKEHDERDILFL